MHVRRAQIGDEGVLRELRIQALTDEPDAFGSTLERELARTTEDWRRWMSPGVTFILEDGDRSRGLVAGMRDESAPEVVQLMAMWVHPALRGTGGGDALVAEVVHWARAEGASTVHLVVIEENQRARRFYERNGFHPNGRRRVRDRDGRIEVEMERNV
jgi:GNAT superfamily N-acetyltransferase